MNLLTLYRYVYAGMLLARVYTYSADTDQTCQWFTRGVATFGYPAEMQTELERFPDIHKNPDTIDRSGSYWQNFAETDLGRAYPGLVGKIAYERCCNPTDIVEYTDLADALGVKQYMVKLDNQTGIFHQATRLFGGNKPRKLGFLLADLVSRGYDHVVTVGTWGSHHAAATAEYAQFMGLRCTLLLLAKPETLLLQRNRERMEKAGARIIACVDETDRAIKGWNLLLAQARAGKPAYAIPTGGSTPLGALGYVNAIYCLQDYLRSTRNVACFPIPDRIYVAAGSFGTLAGLLVGAHSLNWPTKLVGVLVEPPARGKEDVVQRIVQLTQATHNLLTKHDSSFPAHTWSAQDIEIRDTDTGMGYGIPTVAGAQASNFINRCVGDDYRLDPCYTAKACAAMHRELNAMDTHTKKNLSILYWHTFDDTGLTQIT